MLPTTEKAANQNTTEEAESVFLSSLTYMYAMAAKNPDPSARRASESILERSGETISTIPAKALPTRRATMGSTLSLMTLPDRSATKRGAVY